MIPMSPVHLSGKQRRHLRGLGHHLDPVVHVGKDGITEGLVAALAAALEAHELVKLRLAESVDGDRHDLAAALAVAAAAELVQVLGRTVLLYRPRADEPKIRLPE
jgi:RNA-binding protein